MNSHRVFARHFANLSFAVDCNNDDALSLARFLFQDFPKGCTGKTRKYDLISSGTRPMLSLWEDDKRLYFGDCRYQLAYILINEVIFHCINAITDQHALHAGAVYKNGRCLVLPGKSGSGKSTLTGWLVKNGFQYLTDELIFLDQKAQLTPLTRPISLKVGPDHQSWFLGHETADLILSQAGSMIPHRLLNPDFAPACPKMTDIVFPRFCKAAPSLKEISPAKASLYLLQSHVNARSLPQHGISELAAMVKSCRCYSLSYGSFSDLPGLLQKEMGIPL